MTNNELGKLLDKKLTGVATKKDLKNLVTKEDAKSFATKEDLKGLAAKKDLDLIRKDVSVLKKDAKNFATKKDLEAVRDDVQKVEFQLGLTEQRFEQKLEDTFSVYTKKMLDKFDEVIGELKTIREEKVFQQAQFERLVGRVERLEQHLGLQPLPTVL